MHVQSTGSERGSDLEPDEARAEHDGSTRSLGGRDDPAAVRQVAEIVGRGTIGARNGQSYRVGTGRQDDRAEPSGGSVIERELLGRRVELDDSTPEGEFQRQLFVMRTRVQRQPFLRSGSGQVVLRQIGSVIGRGLVRIEQGDRSFEFEMA